MINQHISVLGLAVAAVPTLIAFLLGRVTSSRDAARAEAKAARVTVQAQFDDLLVAVTELQSVAYTNHLLHERLAERGRTILLAAMAFGGGYARLSHRSEAMRWLGGAGAVSRVLSEDRRDTKRATASVTAPMARVAAAAVPLMRHPDRRVSEATNRVLEAVQDVSDRAGLETAMKEFGEAVRTVLAPAPPRWKRVGRSGAHFAAISKKRK